MDRPLLSFPPEFPPLLESTPPLQTTSSETTPGIMSSCEEELGNSASTSFLPLLFNPSSNSIAEKLGKKKNKSLPAGEGLLQEEIPRQDLPISIPKLTVLRRGVESA